ncbi:MAG: nitrilase-related carbon-nitrogen hydrolase [Anaerolineales bacterium]
MPSTLKVAAVQMPVSGDLMENCNTVLHAIEGCAELGVGLGVFPETALTGYAPALGHVRQVDDGERIAETLAVLADAAGKHGVGIVIGADALDQGAWVNRLYAYGRAGELLATYDKVHLTGDDRHYYRMGQDTRVFDFEGITCGLQICYDARFPEGYRTLLDQGAQVILQGFYGVGSGVWKVPVLDAHLRSRAAENGCFVVAANVAGPQQIVASQIIDPLGLLLASAEHDRIDLITADLDLARIEDSEIRADWETHFRPMAEQGGRG